MMAGLCSKPLQLIYAHKLSPYKEQIDANDPSMKVEFVLPEYVEQIKQVLSLSSDENLQKSLREQDYINNQNHRFMTQSKHFLHSVLPTLSKEVHNERKRFHTQHSKTIDVSFEGLSHFLMWMNKVYSISIFERW